MKFHIYTYFFSDVSVGTGKLTSMVSRLAGPQVETELEAPDLPTESQYAGTGIGSDTAATTGT